MTLSRLVRWLVVSLCLLLTELVVPDTGKGQGLRAAPQVTQVLDWPSEFVLSDDILFARHNAARSSILLEVATNQDGKVLLVRPIDGFSLYFPAIMEQVRRTSFPSRVYGKRFVLRAPDPLDKYNRLRATTSCSREMSLRRLFELGIIYYNREELAAPCYKYIVERNPDSVAGRFGVASICRSQTDRCGEQYIQSLAASNPEFIEVRRQLIQSPFRELTDLAALPEIDELLQLEVSLAERKRLLDSKIFRLTMAGRFDEALPVIRQWTSVQTEFLTLYPPAVVEDYQAEDNALLQEAKGEFTDAINSYRLISAAAPYQRGPAIPEDRQFVIDLGLARVLRKSGNPVQSNMLCRQWAQKWRKLVNRAPRRATERRLDGEAELEGRLEFSCGDPEKGRELIESSIRRYPDSDVAYAVLAHYYYSRGSVNQAREAEATALRLINAWGHKQGQF